MKNYAITCLFVLVYIGLVAQDSNSIFDKFESTTIYFDGYKINVETLGTGEPIFFFAGGPGNSHDYMQGAFGEYYQSNQVVFIDMLGRGMSDDAKSVAEYSIDNDVAVAEAVRKALELDKVAVVGHSYGTVVAQALSLIHI